MLVYSRTALNRPGAPLRFCAVLNSFRKSCLNLAVWSGSVDPELKPR